MTEQPQPEDTAASFSVFVGAAYYMEQLLDPEVLQGLLAAGNIGLYGHGVGVTLSDWDGTLGTIVNDFAGRGSGVGEFGASLGLAQGIVTIANTTSATQRLYVGSELKSENGLLFQVTNNVNQAPTYFDPSLDQFYYLLAPGTQYNLTIESETIGTSANVAANEIVSFADSSSLTIAASTATTGGEAWSSYADNGLIQTSQSTDGSYNTYSGFFTAAPGQFAAVYASNDYAVSEANVNTDVNQIWTQQDLLSWEAYVANARSMGVLSLAPVWGDASFGSTTPGNFATSPWYQTIREAALYSGGISFDLPPNYGFARGTAYLDNIVQQIQWATANGLRTSVIISPWDADGAPGNYDDTFLAATQRLVAFLKDADALPSQFIVENYDSDKSSNEFSASDPNSLNAVAEYLSTIPLVSTNSESNLEPANGVAADLIITGQGPQLVVGPHAINVLSNASLFGENDDQSVTVVVALSTTQFGSLSSSSGSVGAGGGNVSLSGTVQSVRAELQAITFTPVATAIGSAVISVTVTDPTSSINTSTTLLVDTHTPEAPSLGVAYDTLVLNVSEDAWVADAQFTVAVDGHQVGGVYTTSALKNAGQSQNIDLTGSFGTGPHSVAVSFLNDIYGGSPTEDTNLYVNSITLDGQTTTENTELLVVSTDSFNVESQLATNAASIDGVVATNSTDPVLNGTAEAGNSVAVSATSGTTTIQLGTAVAAANGDWSLTPATPLATGTYQISAVQTDAAGTSSKASAVLSLAIDTHTPTAPKLAATDTLVLNVSEDAWVADAQFTVAVDGHQVGGVYTTSALKNAGQSQNIDLTGSFGTGPHSVAVSFLNDIYGGSPTEDTNLYVNSITLDGQTTTENTELLVVSTDSFNVESASTASVTPTADIVSAGGVIDTNTMSPLLHGTGEAGDTVMVSATSGGSTVQLGTAVAAANGDWSLTPATPLATGTYQISAVQTDAAGTSSVASLPVTLLVDTHTPEAPSLGVAYDTLVLNVSEDAWVADAQFTVAVDGHQVGGVYTTSALKNAGQSQNIDLTGSFGTGPHSVAVSFLNDIYGGSPTEDTNLYVNSITLDGQTTTENTELLVVSTDSFNVESQLATNAASIDGVVATNSTDPVLNGTAEAGNSVAVSATSGTTTIQLGTAVAAANGDWSLTPATPLATGTYQISAVQTDAAGTSSKASAIQTLQVYSNSAVSADDAGVRIPSVFGSGQMSFIADGSTIGLNPGAVITEMGGRNTYVLPSAGNVSISGDVLVNGDSADLSQALSAVGWDKNIGDLGDYLSVNRINNGADLQVETHVPGGSTAHLLLTLVGQGSATIPVLEQHMLTG